MSATSNLSSQSAGQTPGGDARAGSKPAMQAFDPVIRRLVMLRRVAKAMLIGETALWMAAVWVAGGIAVAITDYFLRMPGWLRGGWLGAGAAIGIWLLWTRVIPSLRFRPSLTEFALRVEQSDAGKRAGLEGVLASAVDLAVGRAHGNEHIRAAFVQEAARRAANVGIAGVLRPGRMAAAIAAAVLMTVLVMGFFTAKPTLAAIGSLRILAPWSSAEWPRRTDIETAITQSVHPLGQTLSLRAALLTSDDAPARTRVEARYRLIDPSGNAGPVRRVSLTSQDRPVEVATRDPLGESITATGTLFERLIESGALEFAADSQGSAPGAERTGQLEFWFTSDDDETPAQRVLLVRPPQVVSASATITPPAYMPGATATTDLGNGTDERASVPALLRGSRVQLEIAFNKPIPAALAMPAARAGSGTDSTAPAATEAAAFEVAPRTGDPAGTSRDWLSGLVGEQFAALVHDRPESNLAVNHRGNTVTLGWTVFDAVRLPVHPVDEHGIGSDGESVYRIESREDRPPEATVTKPAEDTEALATATLEITAEGRDDVGLESVSAEWRLARRPAGSEGAPPEAPEEYTQLKRVQAEPAGSGPAAPAPVRVLSASAPLVVAGTGAKPGDELWITALAKDRFELEGQRHEPTRSAARRVRIISQEELIEQVWNELGAVRRSAMRLSEQQESLREAMSKAQERPGASRDESTISESASRQREAMERVQDRVQRNGLNDSEIADVLREGQALLDRARETAAKAAASMRNTEAAKAAGDQPGTERSRAEAQEQAEQAQRALDDVAELLDKGEDSWSIRRGVERLLEEQKQLRERTAKLGEQTTGKPVSELSPAEQQQAGQLSEQQDELAQRAEEVTDKLQQAAEQMRQQDPEGAKAMEEAAKRAERNRMQQQMEQAAKDIQQNRQQSATQQQDRAIEAMQDMLEQMQQAQRSRDEVLQRELASLVESLDALIKRQQAELAALAAEVARGPAAQWGLDKAMIALRQNTLAVLEMARGAGREAKDAADLIESAATAQGDAVVALRAEPTDAAGAETAETRSLDKLKEARERAEQARQNAQDRNTRRRQGELKKAYRELLDAQVDLRAKTRDVGTMEEGRRKRAAARDLATPQDEIRRKAADLSASTAEIAQSDTFGYAQTRLEEAVAAAATRLGEGEADGKVLSRQNAAIRVLQSILEALAEQDRNPDDLREQNQGDQEGNSPGQGGQSQEQPLIPPAAELKLLRSLQGEALAVTREAAESGDKDLASEAVQLQQQLLEKAKAVLEKLQSQNSPNARPGGAARPAPKPDADADAPAGGEMPAQPAEPKPDGGDR